MLVFRYFWLLQHTLQDWYIHRSPKYLLSKTGFSWKQSTWRDKSRQVTDSSQTTILLVRQVEKNIPVDWIIVLDSWAAQQQKGDHVVIPFFKGTTTVSVVTICNETALSKCFRYKIHISTIPLLVRLMTTQIKYDKIMNDNRLSYNNVLYISSLTKNLHGSIFKKVDPHFIIWLVP